MKNRPVKRNVKDSVFIDMFDRPAYRLQLFQTLHPEMTDITADDIETITLKQVITNHQYNDLAFLVKDRLMVFVESQSSWSNNILIRILLYLADTIQAYLHDQEWDIHDQKKLTLPVPEFYVIYTGIQPVPEKISLRKDFFGKADCAIDLEARVFTAETDDIIGQYIIFCRVLNDQVRKHGRTREAAAETIRICTDRGVLKDYLKEREKEVVDIMIMLFDQEYAVERYAKKVSAEARDEEKLSNIRRAMKKQGMSLEKALEYMDIPAEEKEKYAVMLKENSDREGWKELRESAEKEQKLHERVTE